MAPLHNPSQILQIGTATGIWLRDMAKEWPHAKVVGCCNKNFAIYKHLDHNSLPANCRVDSVDISQGLPYRSRRFDYVYIRDDLFTFSVDVWIKVLSESYRVLRPGGIIELCGRPFIPHRAGPVMAYITKHLGQILWKEHGIHTQAARHLDNALKLLGFVDVHGREIEIPMGAWGGLHGEFMKRAGSTLLATVGKSVAGSHGDAHWNAEEWKAQTQKAYSEVDEYCTCSSVHCVWAKKLVATV
ncbi:hypothetical protein THASP1DRAFT_24308 [Thamnocephalis sphaerospora]|uniref:Methyltransferase domain-containing protein n=1 Tax=Thamnocephalis sphaerospora TaxID=78915 RepID=A0A4P9XJU8_9FUNG|nr:hypothetical protein THASP1DRAFT_25541 [Thamnocephalis sphaerospora]RKP07556.1 hypothetical protein THASP1DRAFT_24308 [Thamnocephalis sphaerospora]|eukprot:RKP06063.1 hypothetical protein THASP1DRAFT_25541 [Thamnocephalis sphaerospora]